MTNIPLESASVKPVCRVCLGPQRITVIEAPEPLGPFDVMSRKVALIHCRDYPEHDCAGDILNAVVWRREFTSREAWQGNDPRPEEWA